MVPTPSQLVEDPVRRRRGQGRRQTQILVDAKEREWGIRKQVESLYQPQVDRLRDKCKDLEAKVRDLRAD